jgi:hypothetical protein
MSCFSLAKLSWRKRKNIERDSFSIKRRIRKAITWSNGLKIVGQKINGAYGKEFSRLGILETRQLL